LEGINKRGRKSTAYLTDFRIEKKEGRKQQLIERKGEDVGSKISISFVPLKGLWELFVIKKHSVLEKKRGHKKGRESLDCPRGGSDGRGDKRETVPEEKASQGVGPGIRDNYRSGGSVWDEPQKIGEAQWPDLKKKKKKTKNQTSVLHARESPSIRGKKK